MTTINRDELLRFYSELEEKAEIMNSFKTLENNLKECDWILEDAIELIAVEKGDSVLMGDSLLDDLVEKTRKYLCKPKTKECWNSVKDILEIISPAFPAPGPIIIGCVLKLSKIGLKNLCE
jgi:hypothetical protein